MGKLTTIAIRVTMFNKDGISACAYMRINAKFAYSIGAPNVFVDQLTVCDNCQPISIPGTIIAIKEDGSPGTFSGRPPVSFCIMILPYVLIKNPL